MHSLRVLLPPSFPPKRFRGKLPSNYEAEIGRNQMPDLPAPGRLVRRGLWAVLLAPLPIGRLGKVVRRGTYGFPAAGCRRRGTVRPVHPETGFRGWNSARAVKRL